MQNACQERFFLVFRLDSESAKACKSCRSRQELSNEYFLATFGLKARTYLLACLLACLLASIQPRTGLSKFANFCQKLANTPSVRKKVRMKSEHRPLLSLAGRPAAGCPPSLPAKPRRPRRLSWCAARARRAHQFSQTRSS